MFFFLRNRFMLFTLSVYVLIFNIYSFSKLVLGAFGVGWSNAKCKGHLVFRLKICSATGWLNW